MLPLCQMVQQGREPPRFLQTGEKARSPFWHDALVELVDEKPIRSFLSPKRSGSAIGLTCERRRSRSRTFTMREHLPFCVKDTWHGRRAYRLGNGLVELVTLTGGGHVAAFRFAPGLGLPTLNPLWTPPWKTIDPHQYKPKEHASRYGTISEGKMLSGIAGHNLCLDYFGTPSLQEAEQGLSLHGEAPNSK